MTNSFDERPMPVSSGMVWQAFESSQIAEIGYESGAEYPLGIKFPPNKKQQAAGESGSEYHYANVTPELHAEFLTADSIGSFFGQRIKSRPDLHPFVKVEAENPPQPPSSPNGGGSASGTNTTSTKQNSTKTPKPSTTTDGETDSGSSLAIIDALTPDALFAPGGVTDAQLAAGRDWYLTEAKKYGIETEEKRTELKRFARPLQKLRTGIEARAKEFTGETKRKLAAIDTEKRRLVLLVGGIETEVLRPLTEWEAEEEARKVRLSGIVKSLGEHVITAVYPSIASLEETIADLESFDLFTMQEYKASAESAIAASLRVLKPELARRQEAERNAAELAELRRKQAEREEADRVAEAKRQEQERIEAAVQAKLDEALEAARAATRQEVIAELATPIEKPFDIVDETGNHPRFSDPTPPVYERPERVQTPVFFQSSQDHKQSIHAEVVEALRGYDTTTRQGAMALTQAIIDGRVPHVAIAY